VVDLIQKGGPVMWLILGCSVAALGVFLERLFYFHRASVNTAELLRGLANMLRRGDVAGALHECAAAPGPVARVAHAVIARSELPRAELRDVAQEAGQLEVPRLERNLPLLSAVAFMTPLLGLLGATLGLLDAFGQIAGQGGNATATDLAMGLANSLLTCAASLAVSIPAFAALSFLNARVNHFLRDMERTGIELLGVIDGLRSAAPRT
jgi:biopolymer transport protein ExbB